MAISIPNFCVAIKDSKSGAACLQLAERLQKNFLSKVTVFITSGNVSGLAPDIKLQTIDSEKDILRVFKDSENDLLIVPITLENQNEGFIHAAEANKLIDKIERMVLTVPGNGTNFDFSKIIVPIDSSSETRQKVPYAIAMAKALGSSLYVVGVSNDKGKDSEVLINNYMRQVINNIQEKGMKCFYETKLGGNPTDQVLEYAKEIGAGLIVIMTEQETNFTSFFSGKYSQQMVKNSNIPVLSIHPKDLIVSEARL